jgi:predicted nucleotide-binding protein
MVYLRIFSTHLNDLLCKASRIGEKAMSERRPSVFIGSSSEGLPIAKAIQVNLDHACEVVLWSQGVFGLGGGTLETLVDKADEFDFAILAVTPDDMIQSRSRRQQSPRDNVLLELGFFVGVLGRKRTMVVYDRAANIKLPSDLAGVTLAGYQLHRSGNLQSSLGAACAQIEMTIR